MTRVVDFCDRIDPIHSQDLRAKVKQMTKGLSEDRLEEMRHTQEFRKAGETLEVVLKDIPKDDAVKLCTSASK